ncbi:MAG: FAD synthetase family protein [Lachnospiraceae bacterium]|nr:FAD synthetase family protein [Lachnospiraceae bacterium]
MDIIQGKNFKFNNTCVTIGKFDGIHIGHRRILDKVIEISKTNGYKSTVFTFDFDYFKNEGDKRLSTKEEKISLLKECGIDLLIDYPFDEETKNKSPETFAYKILKCKLGARALVVGDNFRFGKGAVGDTETLKELGVKYGFDVYIIPMVNYYGDVVSSSRIRDELKAGHIAEAYKMLNKDN